MVNFLLVPEPAAEVTVVAATRNRAHLLPRLIGALESQEGAPPFDVVIANDASTDDTRAVLDELVARSAVPLSAIHHDRRRGPGPGRNAGWRRGQGRLVLFSDDDCVPHAGWVARMVAALEGHDFVQGATVPAPDQLANRGPFSRTLEVLEPTGFFQTCNIGYHRELLEAADGFDEQFDRPAGEDTDLALRCLAKGATFTFVREAVVEHDVRPSSFTVALKDTWRWQGVVGMVARHPELRKLQGHHWFWKPSHPRVLAALAGLSVAAAGRRPVAIAAGAALVAPYLWFRARVAPVHPNRAARVRYLPDVFLIDVAEVATMAWGSVRYRTLYL